MSVAINGTGSITGIDQGFNISSGNLGIGTDNPSAYFSDANDVVLLKTDDCGITIASGASQKGTIAFADGTTGDQAYRGYIQYNHSTDSLQVATTGTERLRIRSDGNIGINDGGDSNWKVKLVVPDNSSYQSAFNVTNNTNSDFNVVIKTNVTAIGNGTNNPLVFFTNGNSNERLRITSGGLVGVNCTPLSQFQVKAGTNANIGLTVMSNEAAIEAFNDAGSSSVPLRLRGSEHKFFISSTEKLRLDSNGRLTISGEGLKLSTNNSSLYSLDGSLSYYATNNAVYLNGAGTNGWLRLNAAGTENNQNAINIFGGGAGAYIDMRTNNAERLRITSAGKIGINQTSPAGQLHIKGNTDESANPSIILDDNGDVRRCYVTNTSGDLMLGGIDSGTVQSRLTIHENGNMYHQRLNSSGQMMYQFATSSSQTGGAASGNTYTEHMAFRQADGLRHGSFNMTIYGDGGDNYMPVLFIKHGYHPTNSSYGGQWFGEMWLNNAGSINPQNYNHTGYNNWATCSFKYRWDCAHWNAKPTLNMIEHYANYGRTNIADLLISGTQSYFVMWLLPGIYKVTYSAWDGLNAWWTNNSNVGGALTHREGGGNTTRAVMAYSARDTRYDSSISWGNQGQT